jgi:hypothetical protein
MQFIVEAKNKYINSLIFKEETGYELYLRDDVLYVSGAKSQKEADDLLAAHNPTPAAEPSVEDKLASVGLNLNDLKTALGL